MAGLTGKGGGVTVNTAVNVATMSSGSYEGYERMQEAMDRILFGSGSGVPDVIDAEPATAEASDAAQSES